MSISSPTCVHTYMRVKSISLMELCALKSSKNKNCTTNCTLYNFHRERNAETRNIIYKNLLADKTLPKYKQ